MASLSDGRNLRSACLRCELTAEGEVVEKNGSGANYWIVLWVKHVQVRVVWKAEAPKGWNVKRQGPYTPNPPPLWESIQIGDWIRVHGEVQSSGFYVTPVVIEVL